MDAKTLQTKARQRKAAIARFEDPEYRENNKKKNQERWEDPEKRKLYLAAIDARTTSTEYQEANKQARIKRNSNPKWRENVANGYKKYINDPEWIEGQKRRGEARKNDPDWNRKHAEAMANKSPETRARLSKLLSDRMSDPANKEKIAKVVRKAKAKPCITPFGVFATGAEAGEAYNQIRGVTNGKNAVCHSLKAKKPGYEYISHEEYKRLTGKDI